MTKYLPLSDFRARRKVLEPEDFAISGKDYPPTDLIDKETWEELTTLTSDVAIQTSNHNGTILRELSSLWEVWITAISDSPNPLATALISATDEFQAAIFTLLHGFYTQSIGCARTALELVTAGCACEICGLSRESELWCRGESKIGFGWACDRLSNSDQSKAICMKLAEAGYGSLFDQRTPNRAEGWFRSLYAEFSKFSHSRPQFNNSDLWESNGPVYAEDAFRCSSAIQRATYAGCYIISKMAWADLHLPKRAANLMFTKRDYWHPPRIAVEAARCLGLLPGMS